MAAQSTVRFLLRSQVPLSPAVLTGFLPGLRCPNKSLVLTSDDGRLSVEAEKIRVHGRIPTIVYDKHALLPSQFLQSMLAAVRINPSVNSILKTGATQDSQLDGLLNLLTLQDQAIRLPTNSRTAPVMVPPPILSPPHCLPPPPSAEGKVLEPEKERAPLMLPQHRNTRDITKQCVNMIRLRRKKMKKHKRKKERKRNKVSHEHRILMNIMRREKNFQLEQMSILREAEGFNAERYAQDMLARYNHRSVPRTWNGKRMPEVLVMELMLQKGYKIPGLDD